jgi:hypothetical protein
VLAEASPWSLSRLRTPEPTCTSICVQLVPEALVTVTVYVSGCQKTCTACNVYVSGCQKTCDTYCVYVSGCQKTCAACDAPEILHVSAYSTYLRTYCIRERMLKYTREHLRSCRSRLQVTPAGSKSYEDTNLREYIVSGHIHRSMSPAGRAYVMAQVKGGIPPRLVTPDPMSVSVVTGEPVQNFVGGMVLFKPRCSQSILDSKSSAMSLPTISFRPLW